MAEFIQKAYFKNSQGVVETAKLYTTLAEVQEQGVPVVIGGIHGYMKYGETTDSNATAARIKRYDNMIPVAKRKFEGWVAYGNSIVTLSHGIAMPEWGTNEATRIQTSGGAAAAKYVIGLGVSSSVIKYNREVFVKNIGSTQMRIFCNDLGNAVTLQPNETTKYAVQAYGTDGINATMEFSTLRSSISDSLDYVAYSPIAYNIKDLDKTWAILSQAEIPYGSQVYTTTGVFTIPAGVSKLRVTAKGAGGGGGGALWVIDDIDERVYLINNGGNGGRGGLSVQTLTVTPGVQYPVTVGRGGSGGSNDRNSPAGSGAGGGSSSFLTVSATGGGGGGGGSYGSSGSSGTNGSPAGAGANGGSGSSGVGNGNGGIGANGSVLIEWGGDIS